MPRALTVDNDVPIAKEAQPTAVVTEYQRRCRTRIGSAIAGRRVVVRWQPRDVAVISEAAARRYFGGIEPAIGRFVTVSQDDQLIRAR